MIVFEIELTNQERTKILNYHFKTLKSAHKCKKELFAIKDIYIDYTVFTMNKLIYKEPVKIIYNQIISSNQIPLKKECIVQLNLKGNDK
ncbi:hypothetical protein H6A03_01145 [[Clostridium] spiroforme]|nr:hypothetical protein [Thomasclavelia spiroformis]